MKKNINYHIWPNNNKFSENFKKLKEFTTKRDLSIYHIFELKIKINKFESINCDTIDEFIETLEKVPHFSSFRFSVFYKNNKKKTKLDILIWHDSSYIIISIDSKDIDLMESCHVYIKENFNLSNPSLTDEEGERKYLNPCVFIGRHFDSKSELYYGKLKKFLTYIGFDVIQGEEYSSNDIPDKVKKKINKQDIFIALVTGDREHAWLNSEPSYALGREKHIILIVEKGSNYNPTILGKDLEQIRIDKGYIEQSFIPLLVEFRSIQIKGLFI